MSSSGAVIADTGFWIAYIERRDQWHVDARKVSPAILETVYVPWPLMYEVLNTRMVKNLEFIKLFDQIVSTPDRQIDDAPYRDACLRRTLDEAGKPPRSLVDMVVRAIIDDPSRRIGTLLTFNDKDFVDVCAVRGIELWPQKSQA